MSEQKLGTFFRPRTVDLLTAPQWWDTSREGEIPNIELIRLQQTLRQLNLEASSCGRGPASYVNQDRNRP